MKNLVIICVLVTACLMGCGRNTNDVNAIEMVLVEGGTFTMGCTHGDCWTNELPVRLVTVDDFYIAKYEVTQELWQSVMGENPSHFTYSDKRRQKKTNKFPVESVSWEEVRMFIKALNVKTGKKYRLPTEAEWEFAARGGNKSKGYKYSGSNDIDKVAWFKENGGGTIRQVGTKMANELGLYDMSWNVSEWTSDAYNGGSSRVVRGGCWGGPADYCRVSFRNSRDKYDSEEYIGFRLAMSTDNNVSSSWEEEDTITVLPSPDDVSSNPDSIAMVFVEGGTFMMGCTKEQGDYCEYDEKPAWSVTVRDFYIAKYEVTQGLWKSVMGSNPSKFKGNDNRPVDYVSLGEAKKFIRQLNAKTGKKYRLPAEEEWEYAARGGKESKGYKYSGGNDIYEVAWFGYDIWKTMTYTPEGKTVWHRDSKPGNSGGETRPVGTKKANELGLYDMSGNVMEWVYDDDEERSYRVRRGGSWNTSSNGCRVSNHGYYSSTSHTAREFGFRLALYPDEPAADINIEMVRVEGGTFTMGCNDCYNSAKPAHSVTVSDFYLGKYEVTQAQWYAVMGTNPSSYGVKDDYPVSNFSWNTLQVFIQKLNAATGEKYRLPTEAEWEYAARGGKESKGYEYAGGNNIDDVAWNYENSGGKPHPVGAKQPNELGLYDMSGNVSEWVSDWYSRYSLNAQTNPTGPASGSHRIIRGCDYYYGRNDCSVYHRYTYSNRGGGYRDKSLGVRLASDSAPKTRAAGVPAKAAPSAQATSTPDIPETSEPITPDDLLIKAILRELADSTPKPVNIKPAGIKIDMVRVKGGTFLMGCTSEQGSDCDDDEKPPRRTSVNDFFIGKTEVTNGLWKQVMGSIPSQSTLSYNAPVDYVSWDTVQAFIKKLNEKTGKKYRLPTEVEWEFAARGGNKSKGYKYSGSNDIDKVAFYVGNEDTWGSVTAGTKQANELGLHDMSGSVWEWTSSEIETRWGPGHVCRGGSWFNPAKLCRVSYRMYYYPNAKYVNLGFRLAHDP